MAVLTRLISQMHPLVRWPESVGEWILVAVLAISSLLLLFRGFRVGRVAASGILLVFVGYSSMNLLAPYTAGTPLWIPATFVPGGIAAVLMFAFIGLMARILGIDHTNGPVAYLLGGITVLLGDVVFVALLWQFITQSMIFLGIATLAGLLLGGVVQVILIHTARVFHTYEEVYDMPLIIEPGLTFEELWGKEQEK